MSRVLRIAVMSGVILLVGGAVRAQQTIPGKNGPPGMTQPGGAAADEGMTPESPMRAHIDEERKKAMNDDRHKRLQADVDKLLALTNELKTDVDKANKDELSMDVVRKAGEIEKLAHDVQSRMKN